MKVSRRDFLKYCGISAAALGLSASDLSRLEEVLASPDGPTVIWLQGAACSGCSVSLLNRISPSSPTTVADLLLNTIDLKYHPILMAPAGETAVEIVEGAYNSGNYILAVEGGVPTAFGGQCCLAWSYNGKDVTFQHAVTDLASRASKILCIGTCASFGGMSAAHPNPTKSKSVKAATGKTTINIAGCPPHPDWIIWPIVRILLGKTIKVDSHGRPTALYNRTVHDQCPREEAEDDAAFGMDRRCLAELGCRGEETRANCPVSLWNNRANWCIDANAPCLGCTEPNFPGSSAFYSGDAFGGDGDDRDDAADRRERRRDDD